MKTVMLAAVAAAALSGCTTIQSARARLVTTPARCADETVQIYFDPQSAELTPEGRLVIDQAAIGARGCRVAAIDVVGLADAAGAPQANLELSRRRADAVARALAANGLPAATFQVGAGGQAGAMTADGKAALLRRRADVTLHLSDRS